MGNQRRSPWLDRSQVFADTQRIDLFDDPAWDIAPVAGARRSSASAGEVKASWWTAVRALVVGRPLLKRGQHSRLA